MDDRLYFKPPDYWLTYFELSALAYEHYCNKEYQQLLEISEQRKLFLEKANTEKKHKEHLKIDWKQVISDTIIAHYYLQNYGEFTDEILLANIHAQELTLEVKSLELLYQYRHENLDFKSTLLFVWEIEQLSQRPDIYRDISSLKNTSQPIISPEDISTSIKLLNELLSHVTLENGFEPTANRSLNIYNLNLAKNKLELLIDPSQLLS